MLNPQSLNMVSIATELQSMNASMFLAQETNMAWNPSTINAIQNKGQTIYKHHKIATLSSQEKNDSWYQPSRTLTLALGQWASWVIGWGQDAMLGHWSYLELVGQQGK